MVKDHMTQEYELLVTHNKLIWNYAKSNSSTVISKKHTTKVIGLVFNKRLYSLSQQSPAK